VQALDGVSLELRQGELLGLLGPNGAGKTTLVRAIAGRVRLDAGTITIAEGALGVVPQEIAVYPALTARENLEAFGALNGLRGAMLRERVGWALAWTALAERTKDPVRTFSGGMRRRLNIACGILHRPQVLLLDEPTVGVDPQSRERIHDMLDELRADGHTLLLTTHQLDEAEVRCTRIVIIDHGRVIADGEPAALIRTIGGGKRTVLLMLDAALDMAHAATALPAGFVALEGAPRYQGELDADDAALARMLAGVSGAGRTVLDMEVRRPSLQAVFLKLTGRELRE
jgi:ABC-2 type transport system ATP-binding protein